MKTDKHVLTKVFFVLLAGTVFLLFLLSRSIHQKKPVQAHGEPKPPLAADRSSHPFWSMTAFQSAAGSGQGDGSMEDAEARFFTALLGQSHPSLDPQTRRALCQAFMCLNNVTRVVESVGEKCSPNSSILTVLGSYGATLFRSDYSYACRICPELDPDLADVVYTNALAALKVGEFMNAASNVLQATYHSADLKRPRAPMDDHYAVPFRSTLAQEETMACSNLLATVRGLAGYDPLSTDLFNDAVVYAMSMTHLRQDREETLRMQSRIARWEKAGMPPSLDEVPDDSDSAESLESYSEPEPESSFAIIANAYRDIFGYRFAEYHGLPKEEFLEALDKHSIPPTATWVHIQPRQNVESTYMPDQSASSQ